MKLIETNSEPCAGASCAFNRLVDDRDFYLIKSERRAPTFASMIDSRAGCSRFAAAPAAK